MRKEYQEKITNRHIAKVLSRLDELKLPRIVLDDIKRSFWFLSDDLVKASIEEQQQVKENCR